MVYKMKRHPDLSTILKEEFGSLFKASDIFSMSYDRLINIIRGRARIKQEEVDTILSTTKSGIKKLGFEIEKQKGA